MEILWRPESSFVATQGFETDRIGKPPLAMTVPSEY
jgi:hypothetical protein